MTGVARLRESADRDGPTPGAGRPADVAASSVTMSLAVLHSRALMGFDAPEVTVEVHLANGLPSFTMLGR